MKQIADTLRSLRESGNLRRIPAECPPGCIDFSLNDYLGIAADSDFRGDFLRSLSADTFLPASSASRLLASSQKAYSLLEKELEDAYGRPVLLFNSGYHANTGMIAALGGKGTLFVADKLVHASIIDGLTLSKSDFRRFRHNDYAHMERIIGEYGARYDRVVIVAESVYSMDGDMSDIDALVHARRLHPNVIIYIDEAHGVGVCGSRGLGLAAHRDGIDIIMCTLGKALASEGAFAVMSPLMREYMVNRCRSLIFSTAISPHTALWSLHTWRRAYADDAARARLAALSQQLADVLRSPEPSHIRPLIIGDARRCVALSQRLTEEDIKVLPIRTPTVPAGTERLRFSLSAAMSDADIQRLGNALRAAGVNSPDSHQLI